MTAERERLEALFSAGGSGTDEGSPSGPESYRSLIEDRLAELPAAVAEGLRPELVAREINESLRQQFAALHDPADRPRDDGRGSRDEGRRRGFHQDGGDASTMSTAARRLRRDARSQNLESAVSRAASTAQHAAAELSRVLPQRDCTGPSTRWSASRLVVAFGVGMLFDQWISTPPDAGKCSLDRPALQRRRRSNRRRRADLAMLTIRAMSDGKGYSARHLQHSDYYAEGERVVGRWVGRGAEMLGLRGAVREQDFEALRQGLDPRTGEFIRQRQGADRIGQDGANAKPGPPSVRLHVLRAEVRFRDGHSGGR